MFANDLQARSIAFYLPQYHPIPENDAWWGKGFTEWTNVTKSKSLFSGHYQPRIPADLGFYDLRIPEVRQAQADLASAYGISGFCYYHYWFEGDRLLERPFNEVLASGKPDFPFCLCWANHSWARGWMGEEKEVMLKQTYSFEDDLNHIKWLIHAFADPRYIRVKGRPLLLIYRPTDLPDSQKTVEIFRTECLKQGIPEPYLIGVDGHSPRFDFKTVAFDGTLKFEPQLGVLSDFMDDRLKLSKLTRNLKFSVVSSKLKIYDELRSRHLMESQSRDFPTYPCVFVSWDNTPRKGVDGIVMTNSTPGGFETALSERVQSIIDKPFDDRLIFINAWNEWAEGNYLEPDLKYGTQYLEAVKRVMLSPVQGVIKC
jgi:lipopolysaccharide biosynthesis protein